MYDDIMVPVDGSEQSDHAVEHALEIATRFESTVHAIHVIDDHGTQRGPKTVGELAPGLNERNGTTEGEAGTKLTSAVAKGAREAGVASETAVLGGDPADTITEYATQNGIDVIVVGAKGRSAVGKFLLGDVAGKVARHSTIPVMIVRTS